MTYQLREENFVVINILSLRCANYGIASIYSTPSLFKYSTETMETSVESVKHIVSEIFLILQLKKSKNHSALLLSLPPIFSKNEKEEITQFLFEDLNTPGLYIAEGPLMALYGYGSSLSGIVIDFEDEKIRVIPIIESSIQFQAIREVGFGGRNIDIVIKSLLKEENIHQENIQNDEFYDYFIKNVCEVSATAVGEKASIAKHSFEYKEKTFTVGDSRIKGTEGIFSSLPELLYESIMALECDKRKICAENVAITGSYSFFKGIKVRLEKDMKRFLCLTDFSGEFQVNEIKFLKSPVYLEVWKHRHHDISFLGSSIIAKMIFSDSRNYITKLDYNEHGPRIVDIKGY